MMKKWWVGIAGTAVAIGAGVLSAAPANAANFDGYSGINYAGNIVSSGTTANTTVDVGDNLLSSAKNAQARRWCAVNVEAGINQIRFRFAPSTNTSTLGSYNKTTDFLWAGTAGGCS